MWRPLARHVLDAWLGVLSAYYVAAVVALAASGHYTPTHYTYWNFTLVALFHLSLFVSLLVAGGRAHDVPHTPHTRWRLVPLVVVTRYVFPLAIGSSFLVFVLINIIVQLNDTIFTADTVLSGGTLSFGTLHTADTVVHVLTFITPLVTLVLGYVQVLRVVVRRTAAQLVYWFGAPLVVVTLYSVIYDPFSTYPTGTPPLLGFAIALVLHFAWMTLVWVSVRAAPVLHTHMARSLATADAPQAPQAPLHVTHRPRRRAAVARRAPIIPLTRDEWEAGR